MHDLFPDVRCLQRVLNFPECSLNVTQFLSGHNAFRGKLVQFGLLDAGLCSQCRVLDDTFHVFYECTKYDEKCTEVICHLYILTLDIQQNWSYQVEWSIIEEFMIYLAKEKQSPDWASLVSTVFAFLCYFVFVGFYVSCIVVLFNVSLLCFSLVGWFELCIKFTSTCLGRWFQFLHSTFRNSVLFKTIFEMFCYYEFIFVSST